MRSGVSKARIAPRGVLVLAPEGLLFVGPNGQGFEMRRILAVKWRISRTTFVVLNTCHVLFLLILLAVAVAGGPTSGGALLIFLTLGIGYLAALGHPEMGWVRVDFLDEQNQPYRAYFTVGSVIAQWTGGGQRLYALLREFAVKRESV
jgi:hypothetical protein